MFGEINTDQNPQGEQRQFDRYVKEQLKWLQQRYKSQRVINFQNKVKKVAELFNQLKYRLKKLSNKNYFRDFSKFLKLKNIRRHIYMKREYFCYEDEEFLYQSQEESSKESQKQSLQKSQLNFSEHWSNQANHQRLFFDNHKRIIKFLTKNRFNYQNIARHFYKGRLKHVNENKGFQGFSFDVQNGLDFQMWINKINIGLFFVFVKDISNALIELQKQKGQIFYIDFHLINIILCLKTIQDQDYLHKSVEDPHILSKIINDIRYKQDCLQDPSLLAKIIKKIKFKLVDFSNAILLGDQFLSQTRKIIASKCQIFDSFLFTNNESDLMQIYEKGAKSDVFKVRHSKEFIRCCQSMLPSLSNKGHIQQQFKPYSVQFSQKGKYYRMIQQRRYRQLILQMTGLIDKFIEIHLK